MAKSSDSKRLRERERDHGKVRDSQELDPLDPPADPARRAAAEASLRVFLETYFPAAFDLAWGDFHLIAIARIERAIKEGGCFAIAMPRGSGKTQILVRAALWAILTGRRRYVFLIGATHPLGWKLLRTIKTELEINATLAADFPEASVPVAALEGSSRRCEGQRACDGVRTRIKWGAEEIVLATVPDHTGERAPCSGAIVQVNGMDGAIRGASYTRSDGTVSRPDLVLLDDPQTDAQARNPNQVAKLEETIEQSVMGLAGPDKTLTAFMACTVICEGDLSDTYLDRKKHPEWQGERTPLLLSLPSNEALWGAYAELWAESMREFGDIRTATAFYVANREAMDMDGKSSWEARMKPGEVSAIQCAMNLKIKNEASFWSEGQGQPRPRTPVDESTLDPDKLCERLSHRARGVAPDWASRLTVFVDVQGSALYWMAMGWSKDFRGAVLDYDVFPQQATRLHTLPTLGRKLGDVFEGSKEAVVLAGLRALEEFLFGRIWAGESGAVLSIDKYLVDAQWGELRPTVYEYAKTTSRGGVVIPSHGAKITLKDRMREVVKPKPGEVVGDNWRIPVPGKGDVRHITHKANRWRTFTANRLSTPVGDAGSIVFYGDRPAEHRLLSEHLTAEFPIEEKVDEHVEKRWELKPNRDNHWWDCLVGNCVAASVLGCILPGASDAPAAKPKRPRINLRELQQQRRMNA